jgi:hypothetical protein
MADYYPATARVLDARVPYEAGMRIVDALVACGLLDPADHEPIEIHDEWDMDRGRVVQICDPQATEGLAQLLSGDLVDALVGAGVAFMLFSDPGPEGDAGRCMDWRPGMQAPRWRDWASDGPLLSAHAWMEMRARCDGDGTRLRRELDAYFTDAFDAPRFDDPDAERCDAHGVTAIVTRSAGADAAPVVFVDTDDQLEGSSSCSPGPRIRINLNDNPVYEGVAWEAPLEDDADPLAA